MSIRWGWADIRTGGASSWLCTDLPKTRSRPSKDHGVEGEMALLVTDWVTPSGRAKGKLSSCRPMVPTT